VGELEFVPKEEANGVDFDHFFSTEYEGKRGRREGEKREIEWLSLELGEGG